MQARANTASGRPVFYAGRFVRQVKEAGPPEDVVVLGDWDVLPADLASVEDAPALVVLDPLSFPFDSLTGALRDVPLVVHLPGGLDADFLRAVFGEPAFGRLGFFDRVATADDGIWMDLSQEYRWAGGQLVRLDNAEPADVFDEIAAVLRDEALTVGPDRGPGKAIHRAQRAALDPRFAAARGGRAPDVPFRVLEVGSGAGRWAASFGPAEYRGLDVDDESVRAARSEWPKIPFERLDPSLRFPHGDEAFDLVFCVNFLAKYPVSEKRRVLGEMWRVTRPGGWMLFLEDFVRTGTPEHVVSISEFVEAVLVATDWQVVMEHVESLRYPNDVLTRGGVVAVSRLGVPKRW